MKTTSITKGSNNEGWLFHSKNIAQFEQLIQTTTKTITQQIQQTQQPFSGAKVSELLKKIQAVNLNKPLESSDKALLELQDIYLDHAVFFHDEKNMAHLNCPISNVSIMSEMIATAINTSVDTWDQSAGATLIEQQMINWSAEQCGLGKQADGVFTAGGTQPNLMAILLARDSFCEQRLNGHITKNYGLPLCASRFVIFCSELSHFSIEKAAALCGLGYQSVIKIACDNRYKMCADALEAAITRAKRQGKIPIAVVATAGTTDFGSIDPLTPIAKLAKKNGLWMHVDAAYGCGLLASDTRRYLLKGIEQADSVTLDFHKSFFQPVSCSAFLVSDQTHFKHITYHADYLNPLSQTNDGTPNLVNKSLQTTRRFDALKLWMTLRVIGKEAIGETFDKVCKTAKKAERIIGQQPNFEVLPTGDLSTLVFRFIPTHCHYNDDLLNDCNYRTRQQIVAKGQTMIAATTYQGKQYLKMTFLNPNTEISHIISACDEIKRTANAYLQQKSTTNNSLETVA